MYKTKDKKIIKKDIHIDIGEIELENGIIVVNEKS
jgi:hypothetical protein